jgi:hypothetical protein
MHTHLNAVWRQVGSVLICQNTEAINMLHSPIMALIECKECHKQVSDSAKACPHCGAKVPHGSAVRLLIIGIGIIILASIVIGSVERNTIPTAPRTESLNADKSVPVVDPTPHWVYESQTDDMLKKPIKFASVKSINELRFGFPYQGSQRATLTLRTHPRFGRNVMFSVERGQLLCGVENCAVSVKFDEGKPQRFTASEPSDHSTTTLFIENYDRFLASARKAKKVYIAAEFYQEGNNVLEFDSAGLTW